MFDRDGSTEPRVARAIDLAHDLYNGCMPRHRSRRRKPRALRSPAARLFEAERLFADFVDLTPYAFRPFAKSFDSFAAYERWKRAQTNPWYR